MATILVIDDDEQLQELVTLVLRRAGHEVLAADNGHAGIAIAEKRPLDLVVTDIFMPQMDGLEVLRALKASHPQLKIVAMSGGSPMVDLDFLPVARALGASDILSKPFTPADLTAAVATALAAPAT